MGAIASVAAVAATALKGLQLASDMEQTRIAFDTMLGSAEAGKKAVEDLTEFTAKTPFEMPGVLAASKTLLAFGLEQEALLPTMKALGDVSAGTGKDFAELAAIFGKTMAGGRLQGDEMNQMIEAGIPIVNELAKRFKVGTSEIKQMVSEGKVGFGDVAAVFQNLSSEGGMFNSMMEKQSKSLGGLWSTLKDGILNALRRIMETFALIVKKVIETATVITNAFHAMMDRTGSLWETFKSLAKIALSFVADVFMNTMKLLPQMAGFALGKVFDWFIWLSKKAGELIWELVKMIGRALMQVPEMIARAMIGKNPLAVLEGAFDGIAADFMKGFRGEAPDLSGIFVPSERTKGLIADALGDASKGLDVAGQVGGKAALAATVKKEKKKGAKDKGPFFGFEGLEDRGRRIQQEFIDKLAGKEKDEMQAKMVKLAENDQVIQEGILKTLQEQKKPGLTLGKD
jgi:tape measure domain-containing protein